MSFSPFSNLILVPYHDQVIELFRFFDIITCVHPLIEHIRVFWSNDAHKVLLNVVLVITTTVLIHMQQRQHGGGSVSLSVYAYVLNPFVLLMVPLSTSAFELSQHLFVVLTLWANRCGYRVLAVLSTLCLGVVFNPAYLLLLCCIICIPARPPHTDTGTSLSSHPPVEPDYRGGSLSVWSQMLSFGQLALMTIFAFVVLCSLGLYVVSDSYGGVVRLALEWGLRRGECILPLGSGSISQTSLGGDAGYASVLTHRWLDEIFMYLVPSKLQFVWPLGDSSLSDWLVACLFRSGAARDSNTAVTALDAHIPSTYLPSVGVWWYLKAEIFTEYRDYVIFLLRAQPFLYVVPLIARFRHFPACGDHIINIVAALVVFFATDVSAATVPLLIVVLLLHEDTFLAVKHLSFILLFITLSQVAGAVTFSLWIDYGVANANFLFFEGLCCWLMTAVLVIEYIGVLAEKSSGILRNHCGFDCTGTVTGTGTTVGGLDRMKVD